MILLEKADGVNISGLERDERAPCIESGKQSQVNL